MKSRGRGSAAFPRQLGLLSPLSRPCPSLSSPRPWTPVHWISILVIAFIKPASRNSDSAGIFARGREFFQDSFFRSFAARWTVRFIEYRNICTRPVIPKHLTSSPAVIRRAREAQPLTSRVIARWSISSFGSGKRGSGFGRKCLWDCGTLRYGEGCFGDRVSFEAWTRERCETATIDLEFRWNCNFWSASEQRALVFSATVTKVKTRQCSLLSYQKYTSLMSAVIFFCCLINWRSKKLVISMLFYRNALSDRKVKLHENTVHVRLHARSCFPVRLDMTRHRKNARHLAPGFQ